MPKVSIVVPVYNVEKYLEQCLESIVNQTLKDIEIICVDDGSTDKSGEILDKYAADDARVKVIHKKNSGYGNSMNIGFDAAQGEYIGIIESDDYAELNMFESLYDCAVENRLDVLKSEYFYYYSIPMERNEKQDVFSPVMCSRVFKPMTDFESKMEMVEFFNIKPTIWSSIYRKDFIRENGIRFNETPGTSFQDASFNFKVWACAERVKLYPEAFLHYRQDNENSSVNSKGKLYCVCDEYEEMQRFLDMHPEKKGRLEGVKSRIKFDSYMWNYVRVSPKYKFIFLDRMSEEFKEDLAKGVVEKDYFEWYKWETLHEIMNNPADYYLKARMEELKGDELRVNSVEHIKNSYTYKIGSAITYIPRKIRRSIRNVIGK